MHYLQNANKAELTFQKKKERLVSLAIFCVAFAVFIFSPVRSLGETRYTMMVAYSLIHHKSFALDRKELGVPDQLEMVDGTQKVKNLPLEIVNGRVYKYAPPGSSILSLPFVAVVNIFGLAPVHSGTYDLQRELKIAAVIAAILTASFAVICFNTSRLLLPVRWSLVITAVATFGTQVWSTASRVVEPDSWTVVLLMCALYLLVAHELQQTKLRPVLLATILSWCYFVHPTTAISISAIAVYLWLYHRRQFLLFAATGAVWFVALVIYSWHNFGQFLPNYFQTSRLGFETFWEALAGNLVSPSRGLLIYVPVLVIVGFMLFMYRRFLPLRPLVVLGLMVIFVHLIVISGFNHWWAGHSYGPRYWTSVVPWFAFLSSAGLNAMLQVRKERRKTINHWKARVAAVVAATLAIVSILVHARGAVSESTHLWNSKPYDIDLRAGRLWNWRYPQFLAGLVHPPLPAGAYRLVHLNDPIELAADSANDLLWYGWSNPEPPIRWTDEKEAAFVFELDAQADLKLVMKASPFIISGGKESQRIFVKLNSQQVASFTLENGVLTEMDIPLPQAMLKHNNVLTLELPDAASPSSFGLSEDRRLLAIAVQEVEFRPR